MNTWTSYEIATAPVSRIRVAHHVRQSLSAIKFDMLLGGELFRPSDRVMNPKCEGGVKRGIRLSSAEKIDEERVWAQLGLAQPLTYPA